MNLKQILRTIIPFLLFSLNLQGQTVTVDGNTVYQTMDGFGGQTWLFGDNITGSNAALFFSPSSGIGLEFVRTANTWDGGVPDLATLQSAVASGASVELSLQSPPCSLKHSYVDLGESCTQSGDSGGQPDAFNDGTASSNGTCFTSSQSLATSYAAYATYIVNYIQTMQGSPNNIPITYLDVQNEPNIAGNSNTNGLGACNWTSGSQFDTFVGTYLGPALATAGLSPKIMMPSAYDWFATDLASTCLNDPTCAQYVAIASGHGYGYPYTPTAYAPGISNGKHLWLSETSDSSTYDSTMTSALTMAQNVHAFLTVANVSAYEWWELAYDTSEGNFGLTDEDFNPTKRFYVIGNWSKFVRPGWVMIASTANPQSGVYVTAFKNQSSGAFALVSINTNTSSVPQAFTFTGIPTSSVTPWITSTSLSLAEQSSVSVTNGTFTFTLPASSVTTFAGNGNPAPGPPTGLNAAFAQ